MKNYTRHRVSERGNVLFLILIAVALFAALSYAVTQSTRSGGGSADREKSILSGASLTQYPSAMRTSIIRMLLNGIAVEELAFVEPANFSSVSATNAQLVFHPEGGAAVFQQASPDIMIGTAPGRCYFNMHWDIENVGLTDSGTGDSAEIIAFLPGVTSGVCRSINEQVGIDTTGGCTLNVGVPTLDTGLDETNIELNMDDPDTYSYVSTDPENIEDTTGSCTAFAGQPTGCFYEASLDKYVFYSAVLER